MRSQMRAMAVLRSWNFRIGWTPGRLLQMASSRWAGQDSASSANSCGLLKLSNGVVVVAAAASEVACAVMLLSVSIVKVVIMVFLCSARCAVNTWITPQGWKRKAILNQIDDGERTAMVGANAVRAATFSAKSEPRGSISAPPAHERAHPRGGRKLDAAGLP